MLYLNTRKLPTLVKIGHGRPVLSAVDFALEKRRNEIINAQSSSLRLVLNVDHKKGYNE